MIEGGSVRARVEGLFKAPHGQHVHFVTVELGELKVGDTVKAQVDSAMRNDIVKNHTATHLLHKALKEVLGDHVNQAGSLVEPRVCASTSPTSAITPEELADIERRVNEQVWKSIPVVIERKAIDEAKAMGAMALFGEIRRYRPCRSGRRLQHRAVRRMPCRQHLPDRNLQAWRERHRLRRSPD